MDIDQAAADDAIPETLPLWQQPMNESFMNAVEDDESNKSVAPSVAESSAHEPHVTQLEPVFDIPEQYLQNVVHQDPVIYGITAEQYNDMQQSYAAFPLPNNILFPWLHGVDGRSFQQNLFFGVRRSLVPRHRGLMVIHADEACPATSRLINSVLPCEVMTASGELLDNWENEQGINLRNYKIQVSRYATISDLVVYGYGAEQVALRLAKAQSQLRQARMANLEKMEKSAGKRALEGANTLMYRVFVILDPIESVLQQFPNLVSIDAQGTRLDNLNFYEREKEEMRAMSCASEITDHVWVGNTQEAPVSGRHGDDDDDISVDDDNPHQFSVCIESHDLADMPLPSTLTLAREILNELPPNTLPDEIIHLDVYATGVSMDTESFEEFFGRMVHLLAFIDDQAKQGRNILIHCSDGYTETSLLALSWIMYKLKLDLPEAYLYLQQKRTFFVYAGDVNTLLCISQCLQSNQATDPVSTTREHKRRRQETTEHQSERLLSRSHEVDQLAIHDSNSALNTQDQAGDEFSGDEMDDSDMITDTRDRRMLQDDAYLNSISNFNRDISQIPAPVPAMAYDGLRCQPIQSDAIDESISPQFRPQCLAKPDPVSQAKYPWFYSPRFEGSFPSRIFPFLYLGNLNHATNPEMLKALGITHVVSVGENANLDAQQFQLLFLDNLYDDGIDSIRARLDETIAFIETARKSNGRCLIHCRVGVSRSAAVTICYVMHHLHCSLVQAYLFVRARRLNVIIQPNLKFMYEMLQLEQSLLGKTSISWPVLGKEIHLLNMSFRET